MARRLVVIGENRLHLLLLELQEEREHVLPALCLAMAVAVFGLLAGVVLTMIVVVVFWNDSPAVALLVLGAVYLIAALFFFARLRRLQKNWQTLPVTLEQLRKNRECLEKQLG